MTKRSPEWVRDLNLLYMLCYAWEQIDRAEDVALSSDAPDAPFIDLLAKTLVLVVDDLLRRGLDRGYVEESDELAGIRGRIDFDRSVRRPLLPRGRAHCRFDEFRSDVLQNQILRASLQRLSAVRELALRNRHDLALSVRRLGEVSPIRLQVNHFDRVLVHRNNRHYALALALCRLIYDGTFVETRSGDVVFSDFARGPNMPRVFEQFVRRFYEREAPWLSVVAMKGPWAPLSGPDEDVDRFPELRTDVVLRTASRWLVIDTKFTEHVLEAYRGKLTLRSEHLYQLYSYLQNFSRRHEAPKTVEGMLLYPEVDQPIHVKVTVHGFPVRIETIDLRREWSEIRSQLLALLPSSLLSAGDVDVSDPREQG